mmetsp:Transcript_22184/g.69409  ORF Transcript_22184/g.69409 Transcript_22184/m.69409 type:complete len:2019 (+) Transcript_22184:3033-9089(+)
MQMPRGRASSRHTVNRAPGVLDPRRSVVAAPAYVDRTARLKSMDPYAQVYDGSTGVTMAPSSGFAPTCRAPGYAHVEYSGLPASAFVAAPAYADRTTRLKYADPYAQVYDGSTGATMAPSNGVAPTHCAPGHAHLEYRGLPASGPAYYERPSTASTITWKSNPSMEQSSLEQPWTPLVVSSTSIGTPSMRLSRHPKRFGRHGILDTEEYGVKEPLAPAERARTRPKKSPMEMKRRSRQRLPKPPDEMNSGASVASGQHKHVAVEPPRRCTMTRSMNQRSMGRRPRQVLPRPSDSMSSGASVVPSQCMNVTVEPTKNGVMTRCLGQGSIETMPVEAEDEVDIGIAGKGIGVNENTTDTEHDGYFNVNYDDDKEDEFGGAVCDMPAARLPQGPQGQVRWLECIAGQGLSRPIAHWVMDILYLGRTIAHWIIDVLDLGRPPVAALPNDGNVSELGSTAPCVAVGTGLPFGTTSTAGGIVSVSPPTPSIATTSAATVEELISRQISCHLREEWKMVRRVMTRMSPVMNGLSQAVIKRQREQLLATSKVNPKPLSDLWPMKGVLRTTQKSKVLLRDDIESGDRPNGPTNEAEMEIMLKPSLPWITVDDAIQTIQLSQAKRLVREQSEGSQADKRDDVKYRGDVQSESKEYPPITSDELCTAESVNAVKMQSWEKILVEVRIKQLLEPRQTFIPISSFLPALVNKNEPPSLDERKPGRAVLYAVNWVDHIIDVPSDKSIYRGVVESNEVIHARIFDTILQGDHLFGSVEQTAAEAAVGTSEEVELNATTGLAEEQEAKRPPAEPPPVIVRSSRRGRFTSSWHRDRHENIVAKLSWVGSVPFVLLMVAYWVAGISIGAAGANVCNDKYLTLYVPRVAVDSDPQVLKIHQASFPEVVALELTIGKTHRSLHEAMARIIPREDWHRTLVVITPDCREASKVNFYKRDVRSGSKLTIQSYKAWESARPRFLGFIMEQSPEIFTAARKHIPNAVVRNLRDFSPGLLSDRRRFTTSDVPLPITAEHKTIEPTIRELLGEKYGASNGGIQVNSWYSVRTLDQPAFTQTGHATRIGGHYSEMHSLSPEEELLLMGSQGHITWPANSTDAFRRRLIGQVLPAPAGSEMLLAHYRAKPDRINDHESPAVYAEGTAFFVSHPETLLRRLHQYDDLDGYWCFVNVENYTDIMWLLPDEVFVVKSPDEWTAYQAEQAETEQTADNVATPSQSSSDNRESSDQSLEEGEQNMGGQGTRSDVGRAQCHYAQHVPLQPADLEQESDSPNEDTSTRVYASEPVLVPPPPQDDRKWRRQAYQDRYTVPWENGEMDDYGNPLAMGLPHLEGQEAYKVQQPSPEQIQSVMKIIGVTDNPLLDADDRLMMQHLVAHAWPLFDDVMRPMDGATTSLKFKTKHPRPVRMQPYRLSPLKMDCLRKQITEWVRDGVIRPSKSPWAFPVLMLPKKGAEPGTSNAFRTAVDFRKLNDMLEDDGYPAPDADACLQFLAGKKFRSLMDVRWGFHNCRLSDELVDGEQWSSQDVVSFTSPLGSYSYIRLPLGVKPASGIFSRELNRILEPWFFIDLTAYIDDVMLAHDDKRRHLQALIEVLCRMASSGLSVKPQKCQILAEELDYLGHTSTKDGLKPSPKCVEALTKMPIPDPKKHEDWKRQVRSFLGMGSWCRRFVRNFSRVVEPLRKLTEQRAAYNWTPECQKAWDTVIEALVKTKGVYHPDYRYPLRIRTDASAQGIGAYLFQKIPVKDAHGKEVMEERVIEYFSRSIPSSMRAYDSRRLELLGVLTALEHFRVYVEGRQTKLETDHSNLRFLRNAKHSTGQLARWAYRLSQFDHELGYKPAEEAGMKVSDALSRNPIDKLVEFDEDGEPVSEVYLCVNELPRENNEEPIEVILSFVTTVEDDEDVEERDDDNGEDQDKEDPAEDLNFIDQTEEQVTHEEIREAQTDCPDCIRARKQLTSGSRRTRRKIAERYSEENGILYHHDISDGQARIVLPTSLRDRVIRFYHTSPLYGHASGRVTHQNIREMYWFP